MLLLKLLTGIFDFTQATGPTVSMDTIYFYGLMIVHSQKRFALCVGGEIMIAAQSHWTSLMENVIWHYQGQISYRNLVLVFEGYY